jgi:hypothetical protein
MMLYVNCNELSQTTYANHFLVNTSITETCCGKGINRPYGTYSDGIPSFERMEGDNFESIPTGAKEEREKSQRQRLSASPE